MTTSVAEIAAGIYRISTYVPELGPRGFTFNQFLLDAEEPLLYHTGMRALFPVVSAEVDRIVGLDRLRWIAFSHVEADECGSMNEFLAAAPRAQVAHGATGVMVSLNDLADRPPRALDDGEVIDLGGRELRARRIRHVDTPHVPHNWEARVIYEEVTGTLFCGDLATQDGNGPALTGDDLIEQALAAEDLFHQTSLGAGGPGHAACAGRDRADHARDHARLELSRRRRCAAARAGRRLRVDVRRDPAGPRPGNRLTGGGGCGGLVMKTDVVVVGGGPAGLAVSHELTTAGRDHVVLERGAVAQSWHTQRWDSLRMITPNWMARLPGWRVPGSGPGRLHERGRGRGVPHVVRRLVRCAGRRRHRRPVGPEPARRLRGPHRRRHLAGGQRGRGNRCGRAAPSPGGRRPAGRGPDPGLRPRLPEPVDAGARRRPRRGGLGHRAADRRRAAGRRP